MTIKARREDGAKEEEEKEGNHRIEKRNQKSSYFGEYTKYKKNTQAAIIVASDLTSHLTDYR